MNTTKEILLSDDKGITKPDFINGSVFFIGTATVLLTYGGFRILTDPNFLHQGDHIHVGYGVTSVRQTNPAMEIEDLPPIDFVLLSHMHDDHFDRIAAEKLDKNIPIITTNPAAKDLNKKGFQSTYGLNTWENITIIKGDSKVKITATPARHGPKLIAPILPNVMGSIIEFQTKSENINYRIYISGDTLAIDDLKEIPQRYPNINLALLHLGGTKAFGVLLTMDAKQGVQAIKIISPDLTIPIHYNDYTIFKSPLEEFIAAVKEANLEDKVKYLSHGETYNFEVKGVATS